MLDRQPLPTHDEVILAVGTKNIAKEGLLFFHSSAFKAPGTSVLHNSPLFVALNTVAIYHFGTNLFAFRLLGVLFCTFTFILLFIYFGEFEKGSFKNASILILFAFLIDPILNQHLHANGNIAMAVFFLLLSLFVEFKKGEHTFYSTLFCCLWTVLALLSYLPIVFVIPFLILHKTITAFTGIQERKTYLFSHLLFWIISIVVLFSSWLMFSGLNFFQLIENIFTSNTIKTPSETIYIYVFISLGTIGLLVYSLFQRKYTVENKFILFMLIGISFCFFLINPIFEKNHLIILPFLYLINFGLLPLNITDNFARIGRYVPLATLIIVNSFIFFLQTINVLADYQNRSDRALTEFIAKYIPKGQNVVGDATAGIVLLANNYSFAPISSSLELNKKIKNKEINYAVIGQNFESTNEYSASTLEYEGFRKLARIEYKASGTHRFLASIGLVPSSEDQLYSVQIFTRK